MAERLGCPSHGPHCETRTYRTWCRLCGGEVFHFTCDHGCSVFFDCLGHDWPKHPCYHDPGYRPSHPDPEFAELRRRMERMDLGEDVSSYSEVFDYQQLTVGSFYSPGSNEWQYLVSRLDGSMFLELVVRGYTLWWANWDITPRRGMMVQFRGRADEIAGQMVVICKEVHEVRS